MAEAQLKAPSTAPLAGDYLRSFGVKLQAPSGPAKFWVVDDGSVLGPQRMTNAALVDFARKHFERRHRKRIEWWDVPDLLPPKPPEPVLPGSRPCKNCGAPAPPATNRNRLCRLCMNAYVNRWKRIRRMVCMIRRGDLHDGGAPCGISGRDLIQAFKLLGGRVRRDWKGRCWRVNGEAIYEKTIAEYSGPVLELLLEKIKDAPPQDTAGTTDRGDPASAGSAVVDDGQQPGDPAAPSS